MEGDGNISLHLIPQHRGRTSQGRLYPTTRELEFSSNSGKVPLPQRRRPVGVKVKACLQFLSSSHERGRDQVGRPLLRSFPGETHSSKPLECCCFSAAAAALPWENISLHKSLLPYFSLSLCKSVRGPPSLPSLPSLLLPFPLATHSGLRCVQIATSTPLLLSLTSPERVDGLGRQPRVPDVAQLPHDLARLAARARRPRRGPLRAGRRVAAPHFRGRPCKREGE